MEVGEKATVASKTITLAITGASGAQYGLRLLECLLSASCTVYLLVSRAAQVVINTETDLVIPGDGNATDEELAAFFNHQFGHLPGLLKLQGKSDWMSPVASGSSCSQSMVVCPCSGGTLSAIATGASNNLIERGADVVLKERKQLILVSRETPYSTIHLEHMLKLSQMGVVVMPASPGFYRSPKTIDDLVNFMVARILDHLGIEQELVVPWGSD